MAKFVCILRAEFYVLWLFNLLTLSDIVLGGTSGVTVSKVCHGQRLHFSKICPPTSLSSVITKVTVGRHGNTKEATSANQTTSANQNLIVTDTQGYLVTSSDFNATYSDSGYYWCNITLGDSDKNRTISGRFRLDVFSCRPTVTRDITDQGCQESQQVMSKYFAKEGTDLTLCWQHPNLEKTFDIYTPNGSVSFNVSVSEASISESLANRVTPVGRIQNNIVGITLHHVTLADAGEYHVTRGGVTENITTIIVFGWIKTVNDFSANIGGTAFFNWTYDQALMKADHVSVHRIGENDTESVLNVRSGVQVVHNDSGRVSYFGNAAFSLSEVGLEDAGRYRCEVMFVVPQRAGANFSLTDEVEFSVIEVKPKSAGFDYPLITGIFILILVLLIPLGICFHIICAKGKSRGSLDPVNMHHGVLHDVSRGSSIQNLSNEIDPMLLHARILAIRRARIGRSRTVSEATVASANQLWFGPNDMREDSETSDDYRHHHKIHFNAVKEVDDNQSV